MLATAGSRESISPLRSPAAFTCAMPPASVLGSGKWILNGHPDSSVSDCDRAWASADVGDRLDNLVARGIDPGHRAVATVRDPHCRRALPAIPVGQRPTEMVVVTEFVDGLDADD